MNFEEYEFYNACKEAAKPLFIEAIKRGAERYAKERIIVSNARLVDYIIEEIERI